MATKVGFQLESSLASQHMTDAQFIKGGYLTVATIAERDALPVYTASTDGIIVNGSLCYVTGTEKFYKYNGTAWEEASSSVSWSDVTDKPFSTVNTTTFQITNDELKAKTNEPNGLAQLNANGKLAATYIPSTFIQGTTVGLTAINTICVLDKASYDALETKSASTMYIIRG